MTPKIAIEKSKGQHIETQITSERSKILTFSKKRLHHIDGIFQIRSTCFFRPRTPPVALIPFYLNIWQNSRWSQDDLIQIHCIRQKLQYSHFINSWKISWELIFGNHQFLKIWGELIFANHYFLGSKKGFIFANLAKIHESFFLQNLFPTR